MDSFFGIGPLELIFILIFALIFLGPERFPKAVRQMARYLGQLRQISEEVTRQINEELGDLDELKDLQDLNPQKQINQILNPPKKKKSAAKKPAERPKPAAASSGKPTPAVTSPEASADPQAEPAQGKEEASDRPLGVIERNRQTSPASAQIKAHIEKLEQERRAKLDGLAPEEENSIAPPALQQAMADASQDEEPGPDPETTPPATAPAQDVDSDEESA